MNFRTFSAASLLLLTPFAAAFAGEPNTLTPNEEVSGWKLLFDGKSTDGWRNYKQPKLGSGWVVEEGALVRKEANAGDIITNGEYESFELLLDYKISKGGNSGLMFHVAENTGAPWEEGPEIQIQDNVDGHDPQRSGWLYQLYSPGKDRLSGETLDATRPAGEWNQLYVRITPQNCEIQMNGVHYASFQKGSEDWNKRVAASKFASMPNFGKHASGHLVLQDHGDEVAYRNIKIREIKQGQGAPNISTGTLELKPVVAFPELVWDQWEPEDESGRNKPFRPIVITAPNDGSNRLFVAEQWGAIWTFENRPDVTESKLFLDIRDRVNYSDSKNEEGFLGFAFHPNFKENGLLYASYIKKPGLISIVSQFQVSKDNPNYVDPATEKVILTLEQPYWNHNGGTIVFGPDGYLYVTFGDGGAGDDPHRNGQNLKTLLGKILRIDVDHPAEGKAYGIPADNPFVGKEGVAPEIYAYGFRNIWRMAFDKKTGHLWAADVGQNLWEEIDIVEKGGNYGWNSFEGTHPFGSKSVDAAKTIFPVFEYDHQVGKSITGGNVYRGKNLPELQGKYIYADYVSGRVWALTYDEAGQKFVANEEIPTEKLPILTFGEDVEGETYFGIVTANGKGVFKFEKK
ncbi:PQQ-dependent sugar dehydrogenase [Planctomicrobium sp. SH668]|uniref:PQQ-dependent sugar dehydrogenase n=1 Tax=Planctomicrobium sp. SH668 TaxID=3448126 RepID=UPI003F5AF43B